MIKLIKNAFSLQLIFLCCLSVPLHAQEESNNTLTYNDSVGSPKAAIDDVSWIAGYWRGEAMGGLTEEIWSEPLGHSMMGSFKLVMNDSTMFYEIESIMEVDQTLILKLKHFHANLKGWEDKEVTVDFKLVKLEENKVYFDGFTFELINENELNTYVVIRGEEVKFQFKRHSLKK